MSRKRRRGVVVIRRADDHAVARRFCGGRREANGASPCTGAPGGDDRSLTGRRSTPLVILAAWALLAGVETTDRRSKTLSAERIQWRRFFTSSLQRMNANYTWTTSYQLSGRLEDARLLYFSPTLRAPRPLRFRLRRKKLARRRSSAGRVEKRVFTESSWSRSRRRRTGCTSHRPGRPPMPSPCRPSCSKRCPCAGTNWR